MKVFISQPMRGLEIEEIKSVRNAIIAEKVVENEDIYEFVPAFTDNAFNSPLEDLAEMIYKMASCDLVIFAPGWEEARGCRIQHECAKAYGIKIEYIEQ